MNLFKSIKNHIRNQSFAPGITGLATNPFYFARKGLAENIKTLSGNIGGRILDVGCGTKPYEKFFYCDEYIGLELDNESGRNNKSADAFYDGLVFPFDNSSFDAVILNQVFEHVFNPCTFLEEVNRVLKPGGKVLLTTPFVWDEHEQPQDYARYSSYGLKYILERHQFQIVRQNKSVNDFSLIFQLVNAWVYKTFSAKNKYFHYLSLPLFVFPINLAGFIAGKILPANDDLYLDNIILAENTKEKHST